MLRLTDDLGNPVPMEQRIPWGHDSGARFTATDRLPRPVQLALFVGFGAGFVVGAVGFLVVVATKSGGSVGPAVIDLRWVVVICCGLIGAAVLSCKGAYEAYTGGRRRRVCLENLMCPGCLYDLRGAEGTDYAVARCPECGGTWSLR